MKYTALFLIICMISCSGKRSPKPKKIDKSYLRSKSFQSFQKQVKKENKLIRQEEDNLASFIKGALNRMPTQPLKAPVVIDSSLIDEAVNRYPQQPLKITLFNIKQIFHGIGWYKEGDLIFYFFLTCKVNYFDNCLFWLATSINQEIKAIQTIAPYYNALPYKEFPSVHLSPPVIRVHVKKKTIYPIPQNHSFDMAFRVNDMGKINRIN